ncbi:riboflavin synthase [Kovacikia minuta CCNUW1]|uniref:riboflavin synthase n=1 Tax=Kovacikia minuta TaxID=2931930 RepID=UPI001CC9490F|nr:riboflavin synthase [Kovacikia minuta]UBF23896.1 riboflavin synthase [Kovacikia minuta CCNUW1]
MFTGLIQGLGTVHPIANDKLQITCSQTVSGLILPELALGDSVAVDGVCLTVVEILPQAFIVDASPETRDRSTLGRDPEVPVNLETSLRVGSKLGGHFVTGHVDGTGYLREAVQTSTSWEMTFVTSEAQVARYILPKGSITVNGISLTVANCNSEGTWFTVAVIPHTYRETNLQYLRPGSWVNLEGDILGKYVEKFLRSGSTQGQVSEDFSVESLTPAFLAEHGYL